ncbi:MAG TPA: MopE-related protein [Polyangiales bacterium]|nr:MopE-related protein [Polyangiales bacterium]
MRLGCLLLPALLCGSFGCALEPVELGPRYEAAKDNHNSMVVVDEDQVPPEAVTALRANPYDGKDKGLELLYPAPPDLVVPSNLAPITFEWRAMEMMPAMPMPGMPKPPKGGPAMMGMEMPSGPAMPEPEQLVFELIVRGDWREFRLYTVASSATVPPEDWQALLFMHAGKTLEITVRALRKSNEILKAKPLKLEVRQAPVPAGALYTWSTTAGALGYAALSSTRETYLNPPAPGSRRCVGCHAVSKQGGRILAAVGGEPRLWSWPITGGALLDKPISGEAADNYVFGSFDPTGRRIAVTRGGRLSILSADDGQLLTEMAWPMATPLRFPDWSPDGQSISVVAGDLSEPKMPPDAANGGSLARVPVALDGSLGAPQSIAAGPMMKDATVLFPSYSPDGNWIVFEKRKGPMRDAKDSSLWIVPAAGGEPVELKAASMGGKPGGSASAPSFMPGDTSDRVYVVFSAWRKVGSFMPDEGQRQLFATAVDLSRAAKGEDPSHPPFWLPFQQRTSSYLRAQWAPEVGCSPSPEVLNKVDDDCDGQIDEDVCTPEADVCGDKTDNDCDGLVDEGCGCAFQEQCGNGKDDDCDTQTDEMPCAPAAPPAGK